MTSEGAVNGRIFMRFVKQRLSRWLKPGDVVVMDNLIPQNAGRPSRNRSGSALPIYLATYSPELNPIELLWSDLKRDLRRMGLDTVEMLRWGLRRLRSALPLHSNRGLGSPCQRPRRSSSQVIFALAKFRLRTACVYGQLKAVLPELQLSKPVRGQSAPADWTTGP
jgi:transposase